MNSPGLAWRIVLTVLLVGLILAAADLLVITLSVLLLIFAGILFGILLNAIIGWLTRHTPLAYRWAYALVIVLLIALIAGGFYFMGSQIAGQASELSTQLGSATEQLRQWVNQYDWAQRLLPNLSQVQGEVKSALTDGGGAMPEVVGGLQWLGWGVVGVLVIFFVGLYVAFDPDLYTTGLIKLVPRDRRDHAREVLHALHTALGYWIIGRLISMSIIGVLTAIGLWILGVPLPVTLGVLAALLTFIPNIGPVLAAVPQALLALQVGTSTVLYVILFNIVLQTVESYLVTPMVQRYAVTLPPALTIFVQLLMAVLIGVIGIIMAAPLTAALLVLVQLLYIRDRLGDPSPGELTTKT